MFKLPIPTRLTENLGEAVVWTVIYSKTSLSRQARGEGLAELAGILT